jgi:ribonucleoside-diphosphate reductase alpha chain
MEEIFNHSSNPNYVPLTPRRESHTQKFQVFDQQGSFTVYATVGFYDNGVIGEVFIGVGKTGASERANLDAMARTLSVALQHGVPLSTFVDSLEGQQSSPRGPVQGHSHIRNCKGPIDLIMKWLKHDYIDKCEECLK